MATSDLALPLVPHLMSLADDPDPKRFFPQPLPGLPDANRWPLERAGLDLLSLFHRHRLPSNPQAGFLRFLAERTRGQCIQVLYDRRFPLPDVYLYLVSECTPETDVEWFQLFRCKS